MRYCIFFLVVLITSQAFAQPDGYRLSQHYTDANGLPQNSVKDIIQDDAGFWWLATENGLTRFNGHDFSDHDMEELGCNSNRFHVFAPAADNNTFWGYNDLYERVLIKTGKAFPKSNQYLAGIITTPFSPREKKLSTLTDYPFDSKGLNGEQNILPKQPVQNSNTVFTHWNRHLFNYYPQKKSLIDFDISQHSLGDLFFLDDQLYSLQSGGKLYTYHKYLEKHKWKMMDRLPLSKTGWRFFFSHQQPATVILYSDKTWYTLQLQDGKLERRLLLRNFDAATHQIQSVWIDINKKQLLMGSSSQGLFVFNQSLFHPITTPYSNNILYAQLPLSDSTILTSRGWIYHLRQSKAYPLVGWPSSRSDNYAMALQQDKTVVWIKYFNLLTKIDLRNPTHHITWNAGKQLSTLSPGGTASLWLGTEDGEILNINTLGPAPFPAKKVARLNTSIQYLKQTADSATVWIGTRIGLYQHDIYSGTTHLIEATKNLSIRSLLIDDKQTIWLTTYGKGLFVYHQGKLTALPMDEAHTLGIAHCIIEDAYGYFWITTNKGLFQANKKQLWEYISKKNSTVDYNYYTISDGLLTNEFNGGCQPCGLESTDGTITLPSINGLVAFNPNPETDNQQPGPLIFDNVYLNDKKSSLQSLQQLPSGIKELRIELNQSYLGNPVNLRSWYAIVKNGQDTIWLPIRNRTITLSTLPYGNHTLLLKQKNGLIPSSSLFQFPINVPSPWYVHPAFLSLFLLAFAILILIFMHFRTRYMRRQNQQLQHHIDLQTAELQTALQELKTSQIELLAQAEWQQKMVAVLGHDIKAPLKYLMFTSEMIKEQAKVDGQAQYEIPMDSISNYTRRLYYDIENMLQYIKMKMHEASPAFQLVALNTLLHERALIFTPLATQNNTKIIIDLSIDDNIYSDPQLLSVILHNLLDNAIKMTEQGTITITGGRQHDHYLLWFTDTGEGMSQKLMDWLNATHQLIPSVDSPTSGLGLTIVRELCRHLNIHLNANSDKRGTVIRLQIPYSQDAFQS